jgi:hypothetical protein
MIVNVHVDQGDLKLTTDDRGMFGIEGASGRYLFIHALEKEGFVAMAHDPVPSIFAYAPEEPNRHHPDPANPVIVHVWKLKGNPDPVVNFGRDLDIRADGKAHLIDLVKNQYKEPENGGDLCVTVSRAGQGKGPDETALDVILEAVDGGFIDRPPSQLEGWIAPEKGYTPERRWKLSLQSGASMRVRTAMFLRSRNGDVYGMFTLEITEDRDYTRDNAPLVGIGLRGRVNASGSRNLEKAPAQPHGVRTFPKTTPRGQAPSGPKADRDRP